MPGGAPTRLPMRQVGLFEIQFDGLMLFSLCILGSYGEQGDLWHQSAFKVDLGGRWWQLKYFFCMFHPENWGRWFAILRFAIFFRGVGEKPPTSDGNFALDFNRGVDAVFLMDMVLQFFTMYPKRHLGVANFRKMPSPFFFFQVAHLEMIRYYIMLIS